MRSKTLPKDSPAAGAGRLRASRGRTCSGAAAVAGSPSRAGAQPVAEVQPWGRGAPASLKQVQAERAAQAGQPGASVVQEELDLKSHFQILGFSGKPCLNTSLESFQEAWGLAPALPVWSLPLRPSEGLLWLSGDGFPAAARAWLCGALITPARGGIVCVGRKHAISDSHLLPVGKSL